jgi:hypothetical protein
VRHCEPAFRPVSGLSVGFRGDDGGGALLEFFGAVDVVQDVFDAGEAVEVRAAAIPRPAARLLVCASRGAPAVPTARASTSR